MKWGSWEKITGGPASFLYLFHNVKTVHLFLWANPNFELAQQKPLKNKALQGFSPTYTTTFAFHDLAATFSGFFAV